MSSINIPLSLGPQQSFRVDGSGQLIYCDYHLKNPGAQDLEVVINLTSAESKKLRQALKAMERRIPK
ncbi:hypothetical protein ACFYZH_10150 [Streptomyces abikoensis]|uniref:hypothetical protein n=1 Tax=Streptomyces abikoensis TaxID=97398 RepID=UPI0036A87719